MSSDTFPGTALKTTYSKQSSYDLYLRGARLSGQVYNEGGYGPEASAVLTDRAVRWIHSIPWYAAFNHIATFLVVFDWLAVYVQGLVIVCS